jgi:hypothetical protein
MHAQSVTRAERDHPQAKGHPPSKQELVGVAPVHRRRSIKQQRHRQVFLFDKHLGDQTIQTREHVPIHEPKVISRLIITVF